MRSDQSAFPFVVADDTSEVNCGMSLRAYFAGQIIGALIASDGFEKQMLSETELPLEALPEFSAQFAVECADALIAELNKESK